MTENEIAKHILDGAFVVHSKIGPGVFESVYEVLLAYELTKKGLAVERQEHMAITTTEFASMRGFVLTSS